MRKPTLEEVKQAFINIGGRGNLTKDICPEVANITKTYYPKGSEDRKKWESKIRYLIENNSSDSDIWLGKRDLFESVYGKGMGYWRLKILQAQKPKAFLIKKNR